MKLLTIITLNVIWIDPAGGIMEERYIAGLSRQGKIDTAKKACTTSPI